MPIRGATLTPTEVSLAREACEPLLASVTDRLLRGGLAAFVQFRQRYGVECQRAMAASSRKRDHGAPAAAAPPATSSTRVAPPSAASSSSSPAAAASAASRRPAVARRINPEGLKDVFSSSGVLFTPEEFRSILVAYSDVVGFVLAEDLLADLHPCRRVPGDLIRASTAAVAAALFAELPFLEADGPADGEAGSISSGGGDFSPVTVDSVCAALSAVFDPALTPAEVAQAQGADGGQRASGVDEAALAVMLGSAQAGVLATFVTDVYASGAVPAEDVVAFVALTLQQHRDVRAVVLSRLQSAAPLTAAPPVSSSFSSSSSRPAAAAGGGQRADNSALFSIRHTACATQRKFEYYGDSVDRRDEWMRGRVEADARPMYMRHAVGYAGHLPEYQYRFGRTFHVIEEDLPQLTKPKPPMEPVAANWYGEGVELRDSRMNAHHYKLA